MASVLQSPPAAAAVPPASDTRPVESPSSKRRWRSILRGWISAIVGWVPITPLGILVIAACVAGFRLFAGEQPDLIIGTLCLGGLAVCILDILVVLVAGLWLCFRREPPPPEQPLILETGAAVRTGYLLGRVSYVPWLTFGLECRDPAGVDARVASSRLGQEEELFGRERGRADSHVRGFVVGDLFGLSRVRFRRCSSRPVKCLPGCGRAMLYELIEQHVPGDVLGHPEGEPLGDLVEMRRYVSGDPLKLVLWKAYARTGRMLVRTPERAVRPTDRMLAFFVPGPCDEPSAGIARAALEGGLLGQEVIFMAEGALKPAESPAIGVDQIVRSANFRQRHAESLDRFLVRGEEQSTPAAFLFLPAKTGAWLKPVCRAISGHVGPFQAIIGVDGVQPEWESRAWRRALLEEPSHDWVPAGELRALAEKLTAAGARVRVVNRRTGEEIDLVHGKH